MSFSKFHKFQAKMPKKEQSYSLIERAINKKNQAQIKQFQTSLGGENLENTWENLDEKVATETNLRNLSINCSALHHAPAHLSQSNLVSARNVRVSHVKCPSQLMQHSQVSINPQDYPHCQTSRVMIQQDIQDKARPSNTVTLTNHLNQSSNTAMPPSAQRSNSTKDSLMRQNFYPQRIVKKQKEDLNQAQRKDSGLTMSSFQNGKILYCSSMLQNSQASFAERNQETQSVVAVPRLSLAYSQSVLPYPQQNISHLEISMDQKIKAELPKLQLPVSARISSSKYEPRLLQQQSNIPNHQQDQLMRVSQQFKNYFGRIMS